MIQGLTYGTHQGLTYGTHQGLTYGTHQGLTYGTYRVSLMGPLGTTKGTTKEITSRKDITKVSRYRADRRAVENVIERSEKSRRAAYGQRCEVAA